MEHDTYRVNDVNIKGWRLIEIGVCSLSGNTKQKNGKRLPKADQTHVLFRFEDPKAKKLLGLPSLEFNVPRKVAEKFFASA